MKKARKMFGHYDCLLPWPDDCFVQCGDHGIVLSTSSQKSYTTAFFEAFPSNPNTFIRGEGATIEEAEKDAHDQFMRITSCSSHEFERRNRKDGYGYCRHCELGMMVFESLNLCCTCSTPTNYTTDKFGKYYCEDHPVPEEHKSDWQKWMDESRKSDKEVNITKSDIEDILSFLVNDTKINDKDEQKDQSNL